jgi:thiol-disulfide isomerase/thioredoxin
MKLKSILLLCFLFAKITYAQYSIDGTIEPGDKKITWAMLYKIKEGHQHFVKNTKVKENKFSFEVPASSKKGMYRVVYRLKENGFIDFLFNNEDVKFNFNPDYPEETAYFEKSDENILYQEYLIDIMGQQQRVDSLQIAFFKTSNQNAAILYSEELINLETIQNTYEAKAKESLALHFIKATQRFNSDSIQKAPKNYLKEVKENFFSNIDFNDEVLINSSFLVDRVVDYVFKLNYSKNQKVQEELYTSSIDFVLNKEMKQSLQKDLIEILVEEFKKNEDVTMVKYLFENYYDVLPSALKKADYKKETLESLSVIIGVKAPEIVWKEKKTEYKLSVLTGHKKYIVVFWSTGCSHCRKQLPEMYSYLKEYEDVQVIAISLEEKPKEWKKLKSNFKGWHHVLGLNKWENEIARTYNVMGTPSYFVLDSDKIIIAKPDNFRELVKELKK